MTTLALVAMLLAGCASTWDASIPPRTVRLVIAVDDAFQFHATWDEELREAVRAVSRIFDREAGIRFEALRVVKWQAPPLGDGRALDHLLTTIPAADADIVVGVSGGCDHTHTGSARLLSRVALATTGCTPFLQRRTPTLLQLLTHELAHVFGAFHPAAGVRSIMRGSAPDEWDSQMRRVVRLMRGFDFARGVDSLDEATREAYGRIYTEGHDPRDANGIAVALRNHGRALLEAGKINAARDRFEQAVVTDPSWHETYSDLGVWHARRQQPAEAARYFREAAQRAAGAKPDVRLAIAARLDVLGDRDGALAVYEDTVRSAPTSVDARMQLATALLRRNRPQDAEPHLREASRLAPDSPEALGQLATALGLLGRHEDSIAASQKALALKPDWAAGRGQLGFALAQTGRFDDAITEYRAALALDPKDARTRTNLVDALMRASRGEEAVREARILVGREPTSTQAWQRLVSALMLTRRYADAWTEVERASTAGVVIPAALQDRLRRELGTRSTPAR
jgi:tetratricopeptide (TPR) repeat protein